MLLQVNKKHSLRSDISWARLADDSPPFLSEKKLRGRRRQGVLYEKKVHEHFKSLYGCRYISNPWIIYGGQQGGKSWAQPDALLFDMHLGTITIIEVKYQHCAEAYWQLKSKYLPLVKRIFPESLWKFRIIEVVKWYDVRTNFPVKVYLKKSLAHAELDKFGVHIWKP